MSRGHGSLSGFKTVHKLWLEKSSPSKASFFSVVSSRYSFRLQSQDRSQIHYYQQKSQGWGDPLPTSLPVSACFGLSYVLLSADIQVLILLLNT